jgi:hypothetical protein
MNILEPIFYRTLFYDFSPVISPSRNHITPWTIWTSQVHSEGGFGVKNMVILGET